MKGKKLRNEGKRQINFQKAAPKVDNALRHELWQTCCRGFHHSKGHASFLGGSTKDYFQSHIPSPIGCCPSTEHRCMHAVAAWQPARCKSSSTGTWQKI